jgi:hypothetical protein
MAKAYWHPNYRTSGVADMHWHQPADYELAHKGKGRASVWENGTWHTWDTRGVGGENGRESSVEDAICEAEAAVIRQGWGKPSSRTPKPAVQP